MLGLALVDARVALLLHVARVAAPSRYLRPDLTRPQRELLARAAAALPPSDARKASAATAIVGYFKAQKSSLPCTQQIKFC